MITDASVGEEPGAGIPHAKQRGSAAGLVSNRQSYADVNIFRRLKENRASHRTKKHLLKLLYEKVILYSKYGSIIDFYTNLLVKNSVIPTSSTTG